jgi:hypothetical protein
MVESGGRAIHRERTFQSFEGSFAAGARDHAEVLGILYSGGRSLRAENGLLQIHRFEAIKI